MCSCWALSLTRELRLRQEVENVAASNNAPDAVQLNTSDITVGEEPLSGGRGTQAALEMSLLQLLRQYCSNNSQLPLADYLLAHLGQKWGHELATSVSYPSSRAHHTGCPPPLMSAAGADGGGDAATRGLHGGSDAGARAG
jgi:hypothetical protein